MSVKTSENLTGGDWTVNLTRKFIQEYDGVVITSSENGNTTVVMQINTDNEKFFTNAVAASQLPAIVDIMERLVDWKNGKKRTAFARAEVIADDAEHILRIINRRKNNKVIPRKRLTKRSRVKR